VSVELNAGEMVIPEWMARIWEQVEEFHREYLRARRRQAEAGYLAVLRAFAGRGKTDWITRNEIRRMHGEMTRMYWGAPVLWLRPLYVREARYSYRAAPRRSRASHRRRK